MHDRGKISTTFPVIYLQQEAEVHGAVAGGAGARGGRAARGAAAQQDPGAGVAPAPAGRGEPRPLRRSQGPWRPQLPGVHPQKHLLYTTPSAGTMHHHRPQHGGRPLYCALLAICFWACPSRSSSQQCREAGSTANVRKSLQAV